MTRIYIKYFFVALLFISAKSSYAQEIEFIYDYYALYNQYSNCTTKHSITSPWLLNGTFVEYGYGYIGLPAKVGNIDTVSFLYFKGNMVFYNKDYNKLLQYSDTCSIARDIVLSMNCISRIFNSDSLIITTYNPLFPFSWIFSKYGVDISSSIYKIIDDGNGNYLVSVDTYGRCRSYNIINDKNTERIKKRLLKRYKKIYDENRFQRL
jgi:hypothetical protein